MKKLSLVQNYIITINIWTFLLCSFVNGMDTPKPEPIFTVKGTDSEEGIEIPQNTLEMSKVLTTMIGDLGGTTKVPLPLNSTKDTIQSVFKILNIYKNDPNNPSIQQMIASFSLQQLIEACNLVDFLHFKKKVTNNFINGLRQQLVALSSQEIKANTEIIGSLVPEVQNKTAGPLREEAISLKKIELLKQKGSLPIEKEFIAITPRSHMYTMEFNHDGTVIALATYDDKIIMLNTQSGEQLKAFTTDDLYDLPNLIRFSHDGKFIILGDRTETDLWDAHLNKKIQSLISNKIQVEDAIFSNDDKFIASSYENKITIWKRNKNTGTYAQLSSFSTHDAHDIHETLWGFSPDGTRIISTSGKSRTNRSDMCSLWSINKREALYQTKIPSDPIKLQFSPDGSKIIGLFENQLIIWNAETLKPEMINHNQFIEDAPYANENLSPDGSMRLVKTTNRGPYKKLFLLENSTGNKICNIDTKKIDLDLLRTFTTDFSPNSNKIAFYGNIIDQNQQSLSIINLFTKEDQNKFEESKKLSLIELLKAIAAKKELK